jgi:hypothetical protein
MMTTVSGKTTTAAGIRAFVDASPRPQADPYRNQGEQMKHVAIIDDPGLDGTYSWFCCQKTKGKCTAEAYGFETHEAAVADAIAAGHQVAVDDEAPGHYDGIPGLVWYSKATKTYGRDLKLGDWLDSLDHRGARTIWGLWRGSATRAELGARSLYLPDQADPLITVMFGGGDTEVVRADVQYDVVEPDSQTARPGGAR